MTKTMLILALALTLAAAPLDAAGGWNVTGTVAAFYMTSDSSGTYTTAVVVETAPGESMVLVCNTGGAEPPKCDGIAVGKSYVFRGWLGNANHLKVRTVKLAGN